ncbi:MAG: polysaccharide deacetylase family protein [Elusimicrobiota bacterium]
MNLISLMYHDIVSAPTDRRYAFTIAEFREHLALFKAAIGAAPAAPGGASVMSGFALTFDDGCPGWLQAGEALQELGWKALFFVKTGVIGDPGQIDPSAIKRLADMGQVIGSHTVDHHYPIAARDTAYILDQWSRSKASLEDIIGREVTSASVPGGSYSSRVGRAAEAAGIRHLFTSEPVATSWNVGACRVWGRFSLTNGMSAQRIARIAAGDGSYGARQYVAWNLKKAAKFVMMRPYLAFRKSVYPSGRTRAPLGERVRGRLSAPPSSREEFAPMTTSR